MISSSYATPSTTRTSTSIASMGKSTSSTMTSHLRQVEIPYAPIGTPNNYNIEHDNCSFNVFEWPHHGYYLGKIIYCHGFGEHSGIYTEWFDRLSLAGYEVFFYEQRGMGKTSNGADFGKTNGKLQISDLDYMVEYNLARRFILDEKFYLMGHSTGASLIVDYAVLGKNRDLIKCIVANAPSTVLHPDVDVSQLVHFLAPMIKKCAPNVKINVSRVKAENITSNPKWQKYISAFETDALLGTTSFFHDLFARGERIMSKGNAKKFPTSIALLILHGTKDRINWIEGTRKLNQSLNTKISKEYIEVNALHHLFIENQEVQDYIFGKVIGFMKKYNSETVVSTKSQTTLRPM